MYKMSLNGSWRMREQDGGDWIPASVPGSVVSDLLEANIIPDPYWRENEDAARDLFLKNYIYEKEFIADPELLACDCVELVCYGLDTLAEIYVNGEVFSYCNNMHRTWRLDVKHRLVPGKNQIRITFESPLKFIGEMAENTDITYTATGSIKGNQYLRKAHCMFGWDWGPQIPDAGIWREICVEGFRKGRLHDVYIKQLHFDRKVTLDIAIQTETFQRGIELEAECKVIAPDGSITAVIHSPIKPVQHQINGDCKRPTEQVMIDIPSPQIWWPNGYGSQPLYSFEINLKWGTETVDAYKCRLGLRTMGVSRCGDQWGEEFALMVNGVRIFAMGADYIPEDSIHSRISRDRTQQLVKDCVAANFNCIRVWGGGKYPEDYFYDLCDEYGLIVWQDFMFACNVYEVTDDFAENIRAEAEDNVRRLRHHPSLGLWCGNNEMEMGWVEWDHVRFHSMKLRADYLKQFEIILSDVAKKHDPMTFYWPSSPSSGGCFDAPNDENRGDVHYWDVWHKLKPFTEYRKFFFRFCSEFGFQSFPCLETVESFTLPQDRNIFSPVMEKHQKNGAANGRILFYIADNYRYPKDFTSLLYISQLLQADAIKYGVEHWRRNRGRCMGAVYWQLNDCWPVASWSGIDYYGRWKALHYSARRFFAPILASVEEDGTNIAIHVSNERMSPAEGFLTVRIKDRQFNILFEESVIVEVPELSSVKIYEHNFCQLFTKTEELRTRFLEYELTIDGKKISSSAHIFVKPKQFDFIKPSYTVELKDDLKDPDKFIINVLADTFSRSAEVTVAGYEAALSDNYVDITSKEGCLIYGGRSRFRTQGYTVEDIKALVTVRSIADSF